MRSKITSLVIALALFASMIPSVAFADDVQADTTSETSAAEIQNDEQKEEDGTDYWSDVMPEPSAEPTTEPTVEPTVNPTETPTAEPTEEPTFDSPTEKNEEHEAYNDVKDLSSISLTLNGYEVGKSVVNDTSLSISGSTDGVYFTSDEYYEGYMITNIDYFNSMGSDGNAPVNQIIRDTSVLFEMYKPYYLQVIMMVEDDYSYDNLEKENVTLNVGGQSVTSHFLMKQYVGSKMVLFSFKLPEPSPKEIPAFSMTFENYKVGRRIAYGTNSNINFDEGKEGVLFRMYGYGQDEKYLITTKAYDESLDDGGLTESDCIKDSSVTYEAGKSYYMHVKLCAQNSSYTFKNFTKDDVSLNVMGENIKPYVILPSSDYSSIEVGFELPILPEVKEINSVSLSLGGYYLGKSVVSDTSISLDDSNEGVYFYEKNEYYSTYIISDADFLDEDSNIIEDASVLFDAENNYYLAAEIIVNDGYTIKNLTKENVVLNVGGVKVNSYVMEAFDDGEIFMVGFKLPTVAEEPTPTPIPTQEPTAKPTPTSIPTAEPTAVPTTEPSAEPTALPTTKPDEAPSAKPTATPNSDSGSTVTPSTKPTVNPTATATSSATPSVIPSVTQTPAISTTPTASPNATPKTGDESNNGIWFVLLAVSGLGIFGTSVIARRKQK